jgi:mRNA-degrading endonuclease toxin of MazEF toxin-antitoxin module
MGKPVAGEVVVFPFSQTNLQSGKRRPALGHLPFLDPESVASVQAIGSLPSARFEKRLRTLPPAESKAVKTALAKACAL